LKASSYSHDARRAAVNDAADMVATRLHPAGTTQACGAATPLPRRRRRWAPIVHETREGGGSLRIGEVVSAEMEPFRGPDGTITTLRDSLFSTVPGSPAYVARAHHHRVHLPQHGMVWSFEGRNAIQSDYRIAYTAEP
jgi:hypothetical protein